jgi:hypothetical protein
VSGKTKTQAGYWIDLVFFFGTLLQNSGGGDDDGSQFVLSVVWL